ncbi:MAG TPA: hypothetical protein VFE50_10210 [Cyclobacteriaceae bacterium]|nr:hypothetical protein [Cyclobacteriaceae bacterium]
MCLDSIYHQAQPSEGERVMAAILKDKGFKVDLVPDPPCGREIKEAIGRYFNSITKGAVGVIYYSGHATVFHGSNFLIPATASDGTERNEVDVEYAVGKADGLSVRCVKDNWFY